MIECHVSKPESDHVVLTFRPPWEYSELVVSGAFCHPILPQCPIASYNILKGKYSRRLIFLKAETLDLRKENTAQAFIHSFLLECLLYARHCSDTQEVRHKIPAFKVPMI